MRRQRLLPRPPKKRLNHPLERPLPHLHRLPRRVPHPDTDLDWLRTAATNNRNQMRWSEDDGLLAWLDAARLNGFRGRSAPLPADTAARAQALEAIRVNLRAMIAKLDDLLARAAG